MNVSPTPSDCFSAQTIPVLYGNNDSNPDVGGVAVAISNIVISIVLSILLRWSQEDVQTSVVMLLSQVYPIMIATAGSINSTNLSLFDAHFAVAVTASPVVFYLVYSAFRDLLGYEKTLFKHIKNGKTTIRCLSLILPFLWLGVNLTISFSPRAFKNSHICKGMTLSRWFEFQTVSNFIGVLDVMGGRDIWNDPEFRGGLGAISVTAMWIWAIYVVRHRYDIRDEIIYRMKKQTGRGHLMKLCLRIWNILAASWSVVSKSHPWMVFVIVVCLHWSYVLGIAKGMIIRPYQLSFGQIMSLFSVLPPILALLKLLRLQYSSLVAFMKVLPGNFIDGIRFLLTGFQDPHPWDFSLVHGEKTSPFDTIWLLDTSWGVVIGLWLVFTGIDAWLIFNYVKAGSIPNPRIKLINDPHSAWKPFSVTMYTYGYCMCYVNIYVWSVFYDENYSLSGMFGSWLSRARMVLSRRQRVLFCALKRMTIPLAFVMCCGPLFIPFLALPLAEQSQWSRLCETFNGEVILTGATDQANTSTASFYYPNTNGSLSRQKSFDYFLFSNNTSQERYFEYNPSTSPSSVQPQVLSVVYDTSPSEQSFKVQCSGGPQSSSNSTCAYGTYETVPYLSFKILHVPTNSTTNLRSVDHEWNFPDDAPSLVLKYQNPDDPQRLVLQTAVTERNYCYRLKTCVASGTPDVATLAPLGIILLYQQRYSQYCSRPRIYYI